jgi:hypothetical protein
MGLYSEVFVGNDSIEVSHLQFKDDTLLVGEVSWENVLTIRSILRYFKLASGLKVNFLKSRLVGLNMSDDFLADLAQFFNCSIPFPFLGIPLGANPRLSNTWTPVIERFHCKLSSWRHKFVSFVGRITLLKSVLCGLPIFFYLSLNCQFL